MAIAILGFGVVGSGFYENVKDTNLKIKYVYGRPNKVLPDGLKLTSNIDDILNDDEVDIVVETLGGFDFAYSMIKKCLMAHKNVVTANKEVVAIAIDELTDLAKENGVMFLFEAAVCGSVPIVRNLFELRQKEEILEIEAITNGTTNYILTNMFLGNDFQTVIDKAIELGYAERNCDNDLLGLDSLRKIAIMADIAYNTKINLDNVLTYGIKNVDAKIINDIKKQGYILKSISSIKKNKDSICIKTIPTLLDLDHPLARTDDTHNRVIVKTNKGVYEFSGTGAGGYPTGSIVYEDVKLVLNKYNYNDYENNKTLFINNKVNKYYVVDDNDNYKIIDKLDKNYKFIAEYKK